MKKLSDVFIKFIVKYPEENEYFVSIEDVLNDPQDCYQDEKDEKDEVLYEWSDIGKGWCYNPLI